MRPPSSDDAMAALYDSDGRRKYLCTAERAQFLAAARRAPPETAALCQLLAFTGCRISEALALTPLRLDPATGRVVFLTLKRRKRVFRAVPVPPALMRALLSLAKGKAEHEPLWGICRQTAWRRVKRVMESARIRGLHACPKGLRHGFGLANAEASIPPTLTQRWMGHARLETTALYQQISGAEERLLVERVWVRADKSPTV